VPHGAEPSRLAPRESISFIRSPGGDGPEVSRPGPTPAAHPASNGPACASRRVRGRDPREEPRRDQSPHASNSSTSGLRDGLGATAFVLFLEPVEFGEEALALIHRPSLDRRSRIPNAGDSSGDSSAEEVLLRRMLRA
jgi:hypothetical protein